MLYMIFKIEIDIFSIIIKIERAMIDIEILVYDHFHIERYPVALFKMD